ENSKSTTKVDVIAAKSLNIITSFRFQRSTSAPASGLTNIVGAKAKNPTNANIVACPVASHAQRVSANPVIALPRRETSCPDQITVNANIPVGRCTPDADSSMRSLNPLPTFHITAFRD
ncbi:MAG: hypothetical protein JSV35_03050, partial [Candidatus Bathyarchaeota archaeon]